MSAFALRELAVERFHQRINEMAEELADRTRAPLDEMKVMQGHIGGLREAIALIDEVYKRVGD
jgi:hypothetical protein